MAQPTNNYLLRLIAGTLLYGPGQVAPNATDNWLLRQIAGALNAAATGGGGTSPTAPVGAVSAYTSQASAQAAPSASVGIGGLIFIVGAVNAGQLSVYQLQTGTPTQGSPAQFQPNDNSGLTYTLVS